MWRLAPPLARAVSLFLFFPGDIALAACMHLHGHDNVIGTRRKAGLLRAFGYVHQYVIRALHDRLHRPHTMVYAGLCNDLQRLVDNGVGVTTADGDDLYGYVYLMLHGEVLIVELTHGFGCADQAE